MGIRMSGLSSGMDTEVLQNLRSQNLQTQNLIEQI